MVEQNIQLNVGDRVGFVTLANGVDDNDTVNFFPIVEVTTRDGEPAYHYEFPSGEISRAAIRQSDLASRRIRVERQISLNMICISHRKTEFAEALVRSKSSRLEVFADWDKDAFVVVNKDNRSEHRVKFGTFAGKLFGECSCRDFDFRKRVCKHLSEVLTFTLFTAKV